MLKWGPEAVVGVVALVVSTVGSIATSAIHWGATNDQIAQVRDNQSSINTKLDQHQAELAKQETQESVIEQKLNDMIQRLDRIERKL